jgi:hypothetical protein
MVKRIIGLGCSWTQGEGGYPEHVWHHYNGRVNLRCVPDDHLQPYEHENSWVNVLCRDHLPGHLPLNLGIRGIGIRASVKQLYLTRAVDWKKDEGIVVLLLSGVDRFDFLVRGNSRYHFHTMWPYRRAPEDSDPQAPLWEAYGDLVWSPEMAALELWSNIREAETFVKNTNFKLVVANAFHDEHIPTMIEKALGSWYVDQINWNNFVHTDKDRPCFIYDLIRMDGVISPGNEGSFYSVYLPMPWPQKYLTNCVHPTIDGYKHIAKELHTFITDRNYHEST